MAALLCLSLCVFFALCSSDTKQEGVLKLLPNRSQFFLYESLNLTCERQGDSSGWTLERNTHKYVDRETFNLKATDKSWCFFDVLYSSDSGEYWCESAAGEYSDFINITVIRHNVILESPALPVTEGDDVTLRCRTANMFSSPTVDFYKDGVLFRNSSTGNMTLHKVLAADGGVYSCNIPGGGESAQSRLTIREAPVHTSGLVIHVVVGMPYVLSTIIMGLIYRDNRRSEGCRHNRRSLAEASQLAADRSHHIIMDME